MTQTPLISVVDDDDSVRESLQALIRSVGFKVNVFPSAEAFLDSEHLHNTDCLILDVRMPGMNGLELQGELNARRVPVPIIFMTAHESDEEARSRALRNGAVEYLIKPISETVLLNAVGAALNSK